MIIKHVPEDFIVEEIPLNLWADAGSYVIFRLTKINLNTEHAVGIIAKRFNILHNIIKYSGTKDRHAHTVQYISIPQKPGIEGIKIDEDNLKLEHVGYSETPLSLGTLKGNKFIITIRELSTDDSQALTEHLDMLNSNSLNPPNFTVPNYFDEQRFSTNNYNIGINILKRNYQVAADYVCKSGGVFANAAAVYLKAHPTDYVGALKLVPKKILLIYIHTVQSYIFNVALSRMLLEYSKRNENDASSYTVDYLIGDSEKSTGKLVFMNDIKKYLELTSALELVGFNTTTMNYHVKKILDEIGLLPRDFIVRALPDLSLEGAVRECFVSVMNFEHRLLDDRAIIEFELPKGAYATIVVKALFNK